MAPKSPESHVPNAILKDGGPSKLKTCQNIKTFTLFALSAAIQNHSNHHKTNDETLISPSSWPRRLYRHKCFIAILGGGGLSGLKTYPKYNEVHPVCKAPCRPKTSKSCKSIIFQSFLHHPGPAGSKTHMFFNPLLQGDGLSGLKTYPKYKDVHPVCKAACRLKTSKS